MTLLYTVEETPKLTAKITLSNKSIYYQNEIEINLKNPCILNQSLRT